LIVGMDFGTTNSGMAVYDGRQVRLLPLDPASANPNVARTALYLTNDQTVAIGRSAVNRYFEQNVGRPVKMQKVWVGEVEVYGADMFYITDVYVWADVLSPGRLFLSIKSGLRDPEYQGTVVGHFYYSLENLIAIYLSLTRLRAERLLGQELRHVVLGRPVRFSTDPQADALAQQRLLAAAFRAGYEKVYLQYEPVAAAYHYAAGVEKRQNILIFDFGGGTLDINIMRLDGRGGREVLATGGIPVAGDVFDQKLVRAKLPGHFGEGSLYGPKNRRLPLPRWIFDVFSDWQRIIELQTPESRKLLRDIAQTAERRPAIEGLISLVSNNYSLQMFDMAEQAKRRLSDDMATMLRLEGPSFHVVDTITRSEFEQIIRAEILAIDRHLDETVRASGLRPEQIDAVIRTGGSSTVPAFRYLLMEKFGRSKVRAADTFSSVTSGLGIIGHGIAAGRIEATSYTPDSHALETAGEGDPGSRRPNVAAVNLALLQRRLAAREGEETGQSAARRLALLILDPAHRLLIQALPPGGLAGKEPLPLTGAAPHNGQAGWPVGPMTSLIIGLDDELLLVTSRYRFFLTTARHLLELEEMGLTIASYFHFQADEQVSALGDWTALRAQEKILLVTSRGYARTYPLAGLVEGVEGPTPLQFDQPLPGVPVLATGVKTGDELVVLLDSGRATRIALSSLPLQGLMAINRRDDERLVGAVAGSTADVLLMVTADGHGRRLEVVDVPAPERGNSRGRVLLSRRPASGLARQTSAKTIWLVVEGLLRPVAPDRLPPLDGTSTRSHPLLRLGREQVVQGCLSGI
jgi:hypothetical chaperone protein